MKFCADPLLGVTLAPVWITVGTSAVTFVPYGTINATVLADSFTMPVTAGVRPLNAKLVIAFSELTVGEGGFTEAFLIVNVIKLKSSCFVPGSFV